MAWRLAKSLAAIRDQVNAMYPTRSKVSDGTIGNAEHASRSSDHNPWVKDGKTGVVTAIDITHDPRSGCDSYVFAEHLRTIKDPRVKFIISNRRIAAGRKGPQPWVWRPYKGANPHDHHCHISVMADKALYDDTMPWDIAGAEVAPNVEAPAVPPLLRTGAHGPDVETLQKLLNAKGAKPPQVPDQDFGDITRKAVINFQKAMKLVADGNVGPSTWEKLKA